MRVRSALYDTPKKWVASVTHTTYYELDNIIRYHKIKNRRRNEMSDLKWIKCCCSFSSSTHTCLISCSWLLVLTCNPTTISGVYVSVHWWEKFIYSNFGWKWRHYRICLIENWSVFVEQRYILRPGYIKRVLVIFCKPTNSCQIQWIFRIILL